MIILKIFSKNIKIKLKNIIKYKNKIIYKKNKKKKKKEMMKNKMEKLIIIKYNKKYLDHKKKK